jgi:hypothetical protein
MELARRVCAYHGERKRYCTPGLDGLGTVGEEPASKTCSQSSTGRWAKSA